MWGSSNKSRIVAVIERAALKSLIVIGLFGARNAYASGVVSLDIVGTISYIQQVLMHIGPALSATLFITAGIFYAIGQLLPPDKRANFHTTSINIIIGAVTIAVLSVASGGLAVASSHLLANASSNSLT